MLLDRTAAQIGLMVDIRGSSTFVLDISVHLNKNMCYAVQLIHAYRNCVVKWNDTYRDNRKPYPCHIYGGRVHGHVRNGRDTFKCPLLRIVI
jgi:hypothetical protein